MLIGELPRGYNPTKYDDVIFSKDGVHLLRIPYEEFIRAVGGNMVVSYTDLVVESGKIKIGILKAGENEYDVYTPGSASILTGTTIPSDDAGADGDLYFVKASGQKYKYLKFEIRGQKTTNAYTQLSEIKFVDSGGSSADLHNVKCTANKPLYTYTQTNEMMFDGFTGTKGLWVASPTPSDPIIIICEFDEPLDISVYSLVQLWTANDAEARDPSSWKISVSNDKINWIVVNDVDDYSMPSTRQAVGYSNDLALPSEAQTIILQKYYKDSGHWIPIYN